MSLDRGDKWFLAYLCFLALLLFVVAPGLAVLHAHMEASAYNRATGANVSAWDAFWLELRVSAEPAKAEEPAQ